MAEKTKNEMLELLSGGTLEVARRFDALGDSIGGKQARKEGAKSFRLVYYKPGAKRTLFTMDFNEKRFWLRGNLRNIGQYIDELKDAPDDLIAQIKKPRECTDCNPKRCKGGVAYVIDGETHNACQGSAFVFKDLSCEGWSSVENLIMCESRMI